MHARTFSDESSYYCAACVRKHTLFSFAVQQPPKSLGNRRMRGTCVSTVLGDPSFARKDRTITNMAPMPLSCIVFSKFGPTRFENIGSPETVAESDMSHFRNCSSDKHPFVHWKFGTVSVAKKSCTARSIVGPSDVAVVLCATYIWLSVKSNLDH